MVRHGGEGSYGEERTNELRPLLTVSGVCDLLSISRQTLYRLLSEGEIPSTRVRGHLRFSEEDIRSYLERNRETGALGAADG